MTPFFWVTSIEHEAVFAQAQFQYPNGKLAREYVIVFGNSKLELTNATDRGKDGIETVTVFGQFVYTTPGLKGGEPALELEVTPVFGTVKTIEKD